MASEQSKAIVQMEPPKINKKIQAIIGKLATLNMFISRYSDHLQLFFKALKGASSRGWGLECDKAFHDIKDYLTSPLTLS